MKRRGFLFSLLAAAAAAARTTMVVRAFRLAVVA